MIAGRGKSANHPGSSIPTPSPPAREANLIAGVKSPASVHRQGDNHGRATRSSKLCSQTTRSLMAAAAMAAVLSFGSAVRAQTPSPNSSAPAENAPPTADNAVLLTVFFKHDQSRPLSELNAQLERQGFYKAFPPAGIEVVSWYVMMGIGQVVTASGGQASRGQSHSGKHRLGQLSNRVLSDL
jgi:hypothetical protein